MYNSIINAVRRLKFEYQNYETDSDTLKLFWFNGQPNFGDILNFYLVSQFIDKKIEWVPSNYYQEYYMVIGSVLQSATDQAIIWGSGLIDHRRIPIHPPKEILAVRGPLTRDQLQKHHIYCPDIYGDPALILPEIYSPKTEKKYDLGIVPHYVDKNSAFFNQQFPENIKVIDVQQENCEQFIDELTACKKIISSSLHGIIVADAYDIPALRVSFSKKLYGGDFKFNDYYLSVNRELLAPIPIAGTTKIDDIMRLKFSYYKKIDIRRLLDVNPLN